jgi:pyruvate dehydrogenase E1 component beta subunit
MAVLTMVEAIRQALEQEMERDERVMILGEDVGRLGGVFRATDGLQARFGEARVFDTPLAEAVIAGASVGLAMSGMVPVPEMQFLGFSHQAFHQIADQIARYRFRSQGRYPMQITIRAPFGGGVRTPEMHSDALEAQFVQCPGLKIVMPASAYDAKGLLLEAIRDPNPVLFCEPLRGYRLVKDEVPEGDYTVPFGKARVVREGTDVTLVAWSAAVQLCERAAERAAEENISCRILDLRTLVPLDVEALARCAEATGRVVVVHEAPYTAGFGAEVIATIQEEAFYSLEAPIARVTAPDTPYPIAGVEEFYIPNEERVLAAVRRTVGTSA